MWSPCPARGAGRIVGKDGWTSAGIMGNNGEKPEGLYQWELAAVRPSNGPWHPRRCWTMHRESRWSAPVSFLSRSCSFSSLSLFLWSTSSSSSLPRSVPLPFSLPRWSTSVSLSRTCSCLQSADTPAAACRLLIGDRSSFSLSLVSTLGSSLSSSVSFSLLGQLTSRLPPTLLWSTQYWSIGYLPVQRVVLATFGLAIPHR